MGNKLTNSPKQLINHAKFGNVYIFTHEGQDLMNYDVLVHNQISQQQWEDQYEKSKSAKELQFVFKPVKYQIQKVPCGLSRNLKMYFPYFPFVLKDQLQNRISLNTHFEQAELYYLLFTLLQISSYYEKSNKKSGNIKLQNILVNDDGQINLITKDSYPGASQNFFETLQQKQLTLLAPEQIGFINDGIQNVDYNKGKAEGFSIGITMLELSLLKNLKQIYNLRQKNMSLQKLNSQIENLKKDRKYSIFFKNNILYLLNFDPKQRFSPSQLLAYISPYQDKIRSLQQFQPNITSSQNSLLIYRNLQNQKNQLHTNNYPQKPQIRQITKMPVIHHLGSKHLTSRGQKTQNTTEKMPVYHSLNNAKNKTNNSINQNPQYTNPTFQNKIYTNQAENNIMVNFSYKSNPFNEINNQLNAQEKQQIVNGGRQSDYLNIQKQKRTQNESLKNLLADFRSELSNKKLGNEGINDEEKKLNNNIQGMQD